MQGIKDFFLNFDYADVIALITILTIIDLAGFWNYFVITFQFEKYFQHKKQFILIKLGKILPEFIFF